MDSYSDSTEKDFDSTFHGNTVTTSSLGDLPLDDQPIKAAEENKLKEFNDFGILNNQQSPIAKGSRIVPLYESYRDCYADSTVGSETRMKHAKALAFALLTHYYPMSEGFTAEPCSLGLVAQHGMNFIMAAEDESDKWNFTPSTANAKKGKRRSSLTKTQRKNIAAAEYNYGLSYLTNLRWHRTETENMAAFVVLREAGPVAHNAMAGKVPYTYLAIMIDECDSPPRLSSENVLHRSDILADLLCHQARIQKGHGILFHGPLLEVYYFSRGPEWVHNESNDKIAQDIEPRVVLTEGLSGSGNSILDMRVAGLDELDNMLRQVAAREVIRVEDDIEVGAGAGAGARTVMTKTEDSTIDDGNATDADAEGEDEF